MTKRDNQKMNMYAAVLQTCRAQQSSWESIPGFVTAVNELEERLLSLHQLHTEQTTVALGAGTSKKTYRAALADHLFVISKALSLKGLLSNNEELYLRNKTQLSELRQISGNALVHKTENLLADLQIYGESLAEYGITPAFIAETQVMAASLNEMLFKPRLAAISKKGLTQNARTQRERIDRLLNEQLDTLILVFRNSLPSFFNSYRSARMIIDSGYGPKPAPPADDGGDLV